MSPRPRTIANHTIARLASDLLIERGPDAVTFAEVAQRCGLAPPTLVQRFTSRTGLLEAAAADLRLRVIAAFERPATAHQSRIDLLAAILADLSGVQCAATLLSQFVNLSAYSAELRKQISFQLVMAMDSGELPRCDVAQLARTLQITFAGAVTTARLEQHDSAFEVTAAITSQLAIYV
jgi:AcrR family transcriptional regulator